MECKHRIRNIEWCALCLGNSFEKHRYSEKPVRSHHKHNPIGSWTLDARLDTSTPSRQQVQSYHLLDGQGRVREFVVTKHG